MNNITQIDTPLGPMTAIADDRFLYLLEFADNSTLPQKLGQFSSPLPQGETFPLLQIRRELDLYFAGNLTNFHTPISPKGTPFQKLVWKQLQAIPFGSTLSYSALAAAIKKPTAFRAAAQANRANQLAIIIPCHRVINQNGELGGYAGGIERKEWLLKHEQRFFTEKTR